MTVVGSFFLGGASGSFLFACLFDFVLFCFVCLFVCLTLFVYLFVCLFGHNFPCIASPPLLSLSNLPLFCSCYHNEKCPSGTTGALTNCVQPNQVLFDFFSRMAWPKFLQIALFAASRNSRCRHTAAKYTPDVPTADAYAEDR